MKIKRRSSRLRPSPSILFRRSGSEIGRRACLSSRAGWAWGLSLSGLASAVAEEGGIGVIAATGIGLIEADYYERPLEANIRALRSEIRKARARTAGILGVNIMVAADGFLRLLEAAVEERIDLLFLGAGLPIKGIPVSAIRRAGVGVVPIVSSGRAARLIFKSWEKAYGDIPDAVVVEGPLAGGHLGFKPEQIDDPAFQLERILPEVVEALREFETPWGRAIPVIAAGGIYTGEDIRRMLDLGARGVQLGTRFIATEECDADARFKQAYVACRKEDIVIIQSPVGLPGRAIRSAFLEDVARGIRKVFRCPSHCLQSCGAKDARYCIAEALDHARRGEFKDGFAFCGANAFRVRAVVPVAGPRLRAPAGVRPGLFHGLDQGRLRQGGRDDAEPERRIQPDPGPDPGAFPREPGGIPGREGPLPRASRPAAERLPEGQGRAPRPRSPSQPAPEPGLFAGSLRPGDRSGTSPPAASPRSSSPLRKGLGRTRTYPFEVRTAPRHRPVKMVGGTRANGGERALEASAGLSAGEVLGS